MIEVRNIVPLFFYHNAAQKETAINSKKSLKESNRFQKEIVTDILPAQPFYPAEDYHQAFYKKNEKEYKLDREKSGRDVFIQKYW